jgi:hypothetical protein
MEYKVKFGHITSSDDTTFMSGVNREETISKKQRTRSYAER